MSKKKKPQDSDPDNFGLAKPTDHIDEFRKGESIEGVSQHGVARDSQDSMTRSTSHLQDAEAKYKQMGWKGIDDADEEVDPDFEVKKEPIPEDELDMTPMVDVTFLLLIFFMVTASFTLQKSLEQPQVKSEDPSTQFIEEPEIEDDYIQIIVDQTNTFYVTTRDAEEVEAPSEREMRALVKDAKDNSTAARVIILAHVDSMHRKVVTAWDAAIVVGLEDIEIQTTDEDF